MHSTLGNKSLLLLKFEKFGPDSLKEVSDFLNIDLRALPYRNTTANKPTKKLYDQVRSLFNLSASELEGIYDQSLIKKVYTKTEIDEFKSKWSE